MRRRESVPWWPAHADGAFVLNLIVWWDDAYRGTGN